MLNPGGSNTSLDHYSSKRRFPRYNVDRPLTAVLQWENCPPVTIPGRCRVISEGGLGAVLAEQLRVGEVVRLQLPSGVSMYGVVRNHRGFIHGFEFVLLRDNQRAAIRRLCAPYRGNA